METENRQGSAEVRRGFGRDPFGGSNVMGDSEARRGFGRDSLGFK